VRNAHDWARRRKEIFDQWQNFMGPWPAVLEHPKLYFLEKSHRDNFTQHRIRIEIAPQQSGLGWLLVPDGEGPFPAVLVVYYEPETSIGISKDLLRDFGYQLARRGFVTLSIGTPGGNAWKPDLGGAHCQPLSFHAYVAANCWHALADLSEVDPLRIGVAGHSYGGKWAMFAAALWDKFAAVDVSDPGIVFDETRPNVNYWEPWYLGLDPNQKRPKAGLPTAENPRTGAYKRIVESGHDLHELQALIAPRPFLVSGGAEDPPERWAALNHLRAINQLLGYTNHVALTSRASHLPTPESNNQIYAFFEYFLKGVQAVRSRKGMVVSGSEIASRVGAEVLGEGGNAIDAAVAAAFALSVTYPAAGNIGGGGFLLYRATNGQAVAYDFREAAPSRASQMMFMTNGVYDPELHHNSYLSVGVPGTVAGLYLAWQQHGSKRFSWKRLVEPAVSSARNGFTVSDALARSLEKDLLQQTTNQAAKAQFTREGKPYAPGDTLKQPVLAATLERIANEGRAGFYEGETARAIVDEMRSNGGLIASQDLKEYESKSITNLVTGTYRGYEVISMPPPSSGGVGLIEMLNVLEGYDLAAIGWSSATNVHRMVETMKRAYADRARYLGDPYPPFNTNMLLSRLLSKDYATELRNTITDACASPSSPDFAWPKESEHTTHLSVIDQVGNAVSLTYTIEEGYGLKVVVPGAGFLLNNELGDFNAAPGLTATNGLIGTAPNMAAPLKRPLSSMTPTILLKNGQLFMVTGSPGGRTIIATVLHTIVNVVDFGMDAQEAVDAPRFCHQWLPDEIIYEPSALSPDTMRLLISKRHRFRQIDSQGVAEMILYDASRGVSEPGIDPRLPDGGGAFP